MTITDLLKKEFLNKSVEINFYDIETKSGTVEHIKENFGWESTEWKIYLKDHKKYFVFDRDCTIKLI